MIAAADAPPIPLPDTNADALVSDRAAPEPSRVPGATQSLTLLLVRHGETEWNADGRIQGHLDVPLSDRGREQARRLARRFRAACDPINPLPLLPHFGNKPLSIAAQFSSDLSRAHDTGRILREAVPFLGTIPLVSTPLLRERNFGDWQGLEEEELRLRRSSGKSEPPNGETEAQVFERVFHALRDIVIHLRGLPDHPPPNVLVFGHGGSLRAFLCVALGLGVKDMRRFRLENTSLSVLEFSVSLGDETMEIENGRLVCVNETAHLLAPQIFACD